MKQSFLKIALFTLYFLLLAGIIGKLFFEEHFTRFLAFFEVFRPQETQTLVIGYSEPAISVSPLANDIGSKSRLSHIYEALVKISPDLQLEPGLAVSFGSLDDLTWEFRLRPGVRFHSGAQLTLDDVIFSLVEAKNNPASGVSDLAASIQAVEKIDDQIFHIETDRPDPLLLQKLGQLFIFPRNAAPGDVIGTGPYRLLKNDSGSLTLQSFENYWGQKPVFERVVLKTFGDKGEKITALKNRTVDIVGNVPPDTARAFDFSGFQLRTMPSLEVNFLMFHLDTIFKDRPLREAVALALNTGQLAKLTQGFAQPLSQFVGNGIFGFDPSIAARQPNPERAAELVKEVSNFERVAVVLDLPQGLEVFGANVKEQLKKAGIDTALQFLTPEELSKKIIARKSEFYFFGWKHDLGDAGDFLAAVVHSPGGPFGRFNGGNYRSSEVDRLIELSQEVVVQSARLEKLRRVMRRITEEDIIGVPLFSPEVLYGVSTSLKWQPRVDGFILAQEVKI